MGAGEKLRAAALKIAQKVPGSDRNVTLKTRDIPDYDPDYEAQPAAVESTVVDFGQACEVTNLSVAKSVALLGDYEQGDREFLLPAESVTEDQLRDTNAWLEYGSDKHAIKRIDPQTDFGVATTWRVVGRLV